MTTTSSDTPMGMTDAPSLAPVDENWETALAVVAHPDDLEYGAAGAIARWTRQGKKITYCMVTSGEAGIDSMAPADAGPLREQEQRAAAAIVGVPDVWFLGHPDGVLEYGLALRRDISRAIRRAQPTIVITANYNDINPVGVPNQPDHIAAGRATIDAIQDAGNRWIFPELLDEGLEPWSGVQAALVSSSPTGRHAVDITDTFTLGIASLKAHAEYLAGIGDNAGPDPAMMLEMMARRTGAGLGVTYAAGFEVVPFKPPQPPTPNG